MKLKLDEKLSQDLAGLLRGLGHDVHTVSEEGLLTQPDEIIGQAANQENRILLTLDVDFSDIRRYAREAIPESYCFD